MARIWLATALSLVVAGSAAAAADRTGRVVVSDRSPFTVRGASFGPHERVTVTVAARHRETHRVLAGTTGRFAAVFRDLSVGTCEAYTVRAVGNRGTLASLKVVPECASAGNEPGALYPTDPVPKKP